jgi:ubiquinone/menaquinone biosynthesis C-methylase UbiE
MQIAPERSTMQERWLRFFNSVGYNTLAPLYASIDWLTLGTWWRLVHRALEYVPAGRDVLEVGFGPGKLHLALARQAEKLIGLDMALGMCRITARRLRRAGMKPRLVQGSALSIPFADHAFDVIVCTFALSGIPNASQVLAEFSRGLRPGGQVVLVEIGLPSDGNRVGTFWVRLWQSMGVFLYDQRALLKAVGLCVVTYEEYGPGRHIRIIVATKDSASTA